MPFRSTVPSISQLRKWPFVARKTFCCEIGLPLRKSKRPLIFLYFFIKIDHLSCQKVSERKNTRATVRSLSHLISKQHEPPAITSGHFLQSAMARTRGTKSSFPSGRKRVVRKAPVQGSTSEPPQQVAAPPLTEPSPLSPPTRRYQTRSGGRPPQKKARVVDSKPIDLMEQSPNPSPEQSSEPPTEPQPPLAESQIPSGIAPEVLIRRPMVAQPPIEGNLDYRARPFHSEMCFDTATFRL